MFHVAAIVYCVTTRVEKCVVRSADRPVFFLGGHVSLVISCPVLN